MAGRRSRRASVSTTATIDHSRIRWTKESSLLKPVGKHEDEADWPCYVVTDAMVYHKDGKTLANPLYVGIEGPLIVRGKLEEPEEEDQANLLRPGTKSAYIEISDIEKYSIGDPATCWVAGNAGWFEIVPAPQYEGMYRQVTEAITLYYGVATVYENYQANCQERQLKKKKPLAPPTLHEVLFKSAVNIGDGAVLAEFEKRCHKWAKFLISHFPIDKEMEWDGTAFATWIYHSHPDLKKKYADAAAALAARPAPATRTPSISASERRSQSKGTLELQSSRSTRASRRGSHEEDVEMKDVSSGPSKSPPAQRFRKSVEPRPITKTHVPLPARYSHLQQQETAKSSPAIKPLSTPKSSVPPTVDLATTSSSDPVVDRLLVILQEVSAGLNLEKVMPTRVHSYLYQKCKVRKYAAAPLITAHYAPQLLARLGQAWHGTPYYNWLTEVAGHPPTDPDLITVEEMPDSTFRRGTNAGRPSKPPASATPATYTERDESEDDTRQPPVGTRRSGKGAGLRPQASSKKRYMSEMDDSALSDGRRGRKSMKFMQTSDSEEDDDDASDAASPQAQEDVIDDILGDRIPAPKDAVRIVVHAERIPTMSPAGPNGTWVCGQEGCNFVVRSAEEPAGQDLIQHHFKDHEAQAEKINLAMKESRGQLPINHLLDKIQAIGQTALAKKRGKLNGEPLAPPIKRRLLV
ncbi:hypothetical protein B0T22DRAFT_465976 [Podospora appendiculata]|uniref:DNA (cytosine-5)-methyltransferase 1 replication foci domain-containing protein n=1 Tax=Podospora appendiculata TaxID=314037 RepID=A0AAE0X5V8_9PEZI|nr:hypothetical protein B0T22DRAFT_465976 [Podospora appendiculata]